MSNKSGMPPLKKNPNWKSNILSADEGLAGISKLYAT